MFTNCWSCSASANCAWCGNEGLCLHMSNASQCPFTLWKGTCCRTLTPLGCAACIAQPRCGYCDKWGCAEGTSQGPSSSPSRSTFSSSDLFFFSSPSSSCPTQWSFQRCFVPPLIVTFEASNVLFSFVVTVGAGLVVACVAVLVFFFVRSLRRTMAEADFARQVQKARQEQQQHILQQHHHTSSSSLLEGGKKKKKKSLSAAGAGKEEHLYPGVSSVSFPSSGRCGDVASNGKVWRCPTCRQNQHQQQQPCKKIFDEDIDMPQVHYESFAMLRSVIDDDD